jgi:hypothetical protein
MTAKLDKEATARSRDSSRKAGKVNQILGKFLTAIEVVGNKIPHPSSSSPLSSLLLPSQARLWTRPVSGRSTPPVTE